MLVSIIDYISVIVFVIDSIPTETEKTGALFTSGKKGCDKKNNITLLPTQRESRTGE